jgi:hypothetical protein
MNSATATLELSIDLIEEKVKVETLNLAMLTRGTILWDLR